jgi:hypothetical protein
VSNDTSKSYNVDGKLSKYDLDAFEAGRVYYNARMLLNKLCADGYIEAGEYIIECSW